MNGRIGDDGFGEDLDTARIPRDCAFAMTASPSRASASVIPTRTQN